jgi:hypothetical protein
MLDPVLVPHGSSTDNCSYAVDNSCRLSSPHGRVNVRWMKAYRTERWDFGPEGFSSVEEQISFLPLLLEIMFYSQRLHLVSQQTVRDASVALLLCISDPKKVLFVQHSRIKSSSF